MKNHPGCSACTLSRTKGSCLSSPEKMSGKEIICLGIRKKAYFLMFILNPFT